MSLKRNFSFFLTAVAGAVVFAGSAMAQETTAPKADDKAGHHQKGDRKFGRGQFGHHRFGKHRGFGGGMMFRDLNLTDAQKEQIKQIREANKPNKADFEAIRPLMEAKRSGTITADQEAQLKAFRDARQAKAQTVRDQILAVLTAEQKATLELKKAEMKQKREEFKKNRELRRQQKQDGATTEKKVS